MLAFVRDGDTVLVHSMDRLARNLDDLRALVRTLTARGVRVQFTKEQLTFTGEDTAMATLLLSVMGAFAEFERSLIRERQREGIALARQRGAYRGRARALDAEQVAQLRQRVTDGAAKATLAREFGVSRETVYQYLRASPGAEQAGCCQARPSQARPSQARPGGRRGVPQFGTSTPLRPVHRRAGPSAARTLFHLDATDPDLVLFIHVPELLQPEAGTGPGRCTEPVARHSPAPAGSVRPAFGRLSLLQAAPRMVRGRSSPGKGAQDPSSGAPREASWA